MGTACSIKVSKREKEKKTAREKVNVKVNVSHLPPTFEPGSKDGTLKVPAARPWVQPMPTPMPKGFPLLTPEISVGYDPLHNDGARLSVATCNSGSDGLSTSGSSMRGSVDVCSTFSSATTTSRTTASSSAQEIWPLPPRLRALPPSMKRTLLGHTEGVTSFKVTPKIIRLNLLASPDDSMSERLALWQHTFMPLRSWCAHRGYVLDIQDDHCWTHELFKNFPNLAMLCDGGGGGGGDGDGSGSDDWATVDGISTVNLVILPDEIRRCLPLTLINEIYTSVLVSLPHSTQATLLQKLYKNNENRIPSVYELQSQELYNVEYSQLSTLIRVTRDVVVKEHKEFSRFEPDFYSSIQNLVSGSGSTSQLSEMTVVLKKTTNQPHNQAVQESSLSTSTDAERNSVMEFDENNDDFDNEESVMKSEKERGQKRAESFLKQMKEIVPEKRIIECTVGEEEDTKEYSPVTVVNLQEACKRVGEEIKNILEAIFEEREQQEAEPATGVPQSLLEELLAQDHHVQRMTSSSHQLQSSVLEILKNHVTGDNTNPILVYAEPGWGLSTLFAQLVNFSAQQLGKTLIVYRSLGISPDSRSLLSTLLSIQQQLDAILGSDSTSVNRKQLFDPTTPSSSLLSVIVNRSSAHLPMLLLLEGVAVDKTSLNELEVLTLTEALPSTTKVIIMTSSVNVASGLRTKICNLDYVKGAPWNEHDMESIFNETLAANRRTVTHDQKRVLLSGVRNCPVPLYANTAAFLASRWSHTKTVNDQEMPWSIDGLINMLFEFLSRCVPHDCLNTILSYLTESVSGISPWEMNDLLSVNDVVLLSIYRDERDPPIHRVPAVLWKKISEYLSPFLGRYTSNNYVTHIWMSSSYRRCALSIYQNNSVTFTILQREIIDHFQGRWADKKKPFPDPEEEIALLQDRFVMPQPDFFGKFLNVRKFLCLTHHIINSKNKPAYVLATCVFNLEWLMNKMNATSVIQVLCDLQNVINMDGSTPYHDVLLNMQQAISSHSYALSVTGREIYKVLEHIINVKLNSKPTNKLQKSDSVGSSGSSYDEIETMYESLTKPPIPLLRPLDDVIVTSMTELSRTPIPMPSINALTSVSYKDQHVAAIVRFEGEVRIIDTVKNEVVRTLTGLDHPQSLIMLDSVRAVVLCNRELVILDLDQGKITSKLRGVLNIRLPLYALRNSEQVVALSRDRMVVNIFNIESGNIVANFKAGETRFLDSLIISGDGSVLVCGDETQKPFPILVWSLDQCKLLHDLRMSQHEFVTQLAGISHGGEYLACACKEVNNSKLNFIVVYDLKGGQLVKKFKMASKTTALVLASPTLTVIAYLATGQLAVWDIVSGNCNFIIDGVGVQADHLQLREDGKQCLSYCTDEMSASALTICLWDLERGLCLAVHTFPSPVTCAHLSCDGCLVLAGLKGQPHPIRLLVVQEGEEFTSARERWIAERDARSVAFGDLSRFKAIIAVNGQDVYDSK